MAVERRVGGIFHERPLVRRLLVGPALAAVVIAVLPGPASADGGERHVVEAAYTTPAVGMAGGSNKAYYFDCYMQIGCAILPLRNRTRSALVEIVDHSGGSIYGRAFLMPGGVHVGDFCGETKVPTYGATELLVHVIGGICPDGATPSTATSGVVRATLRRSR